MRKAPCLIEHFQEIDIFFGKIACTVRMFRHGEMLLLPHARRIARHRNGTRRGNSSFPFHFVFRIRHCVFSSRAHISSWSRTRDTTSIRGLNHGWNRTIVSTENCMKRSSATTHAKLQWKHLTRLQNKMFATMHKILSMQVRNVTGMMPHVGSSGQWTQRCSVICQCNCFCAVETFVTKCWSVTK